MRLENKSEVLDFFESISKYYQSKTQIIEGITDSIDLPSTANTTWNMFEFELINSVYKPIGNKFIIESKQHYFEIAAQKIVLFNKPGRNKFELIEQYNETFFRIIKIKFEYKY